ncbi:hypothetical protein RJ639_035479 [Escallonia herrerae]|uniref:Transposase (putative) gypsy type domain-containing protein n=1 Tax=Escallonia herrerae TaxID=1293975 RepID=A0AA89BCH3_9ASTE|nr:hypothetical protein RJ639_035479 [Escallonia herrerae]
MSENSTSASTFEEDIVVSSSSSSSSERVPTSNPQPPQPSTSQPVQPLTSQPPQPSTSQPSHYLPAKNALGDVKHQAEDKANPKPWYTVDKKASKMSTEDLLELIREYPLPEANYGIRFETGIYEEQVKSGYKLPLHPFALRFFEHYHMAPRQLVPNGWRKLAGLIVERVSINEDPIFRPRWTLRCHDIGMPDGQISEQRLAHGVLPRDKEAFQNQTHETFACSFAQAMYASGSKMLSCFEMARQVAAEEAQPKRDAVKEAEEATHRAEELSKQDADYLARIKTLEGD